MSFEAVLVFHGLVRMKRGAQSPVRMTHLMTGIVLIPVCIFCLVWLIPNNTIPPTSADDISPGLIPSLAVGVGLIMSILLALRAWRLSSAQADELDDEFGEEATGIDAQVLLNTGLWALGSGIAWAIISYVGFEPGMTVLLGATLLYIRVYDVKPLIGTAVIMPILLSQAAWYFFTTEMPGIWR